MEAPFADRPLLARLQIGAIPLGAAPAGPLRSRRFLELHLGPAQKLVVLGHAFWSLETRRERPVDGSYTCRMESSRNRSDRCGAVGW